MAPPIPLPHVASTLALSFTAGATELAAEPAVETAPIQQADGVPKPPSLPEVPGETPEPEPDPVTTEPDPSDPETTTTAAEPDPAEPVGAPPPPVEDLGPDPTPAPAVSNDPFVVETPWESSEGTKDKGASLLRETDRRLFFNLFVGGAKGLRNSYSYLPGMDFKAEVAVGGHTSDLRIGGAAVIQVSSGFPLNTLTIAPRIQFNRQIVPDYAFYFTTTLTLGYRASTYTGYGIFQGLADVYQHSAVGAVGWGVSAIVAERLLLSFRPLNLELAVPAPNLVDFNWDVLGGLGVVW